MVSLCRNQEFQKQYPSNCIEKTFMFYLALLPFLLLPSLTLAAKPFLPTSFRADYEQTIKKKISGKLKKSYGRIEYLYPGNVRFEQSNPENVIWVSNPKTTWFYQAPFIKEEPGNLRISNTDSDSPSKIFDFLKNGLNNNDIYKVKKNGNKIEFLFNHKRIHSKFSKAILTFNGPLFFESLRSITMIEKNGDPLELTFKSIITNTGLKPKHFIFSPPPNTRIEGQ